MRNLERDISKICRKVVKSLLLKESEGKARKAKGPVDVNSKNLDKYLGVRRFTYGIAEKKNQVGQVTGLAWTEVGGDLLTIEAVVAARQGQDDHDRQARRSDERVDRRGAVGGAPSLASSSASRRTSTRRPTCTSTCPKARRPRTARRAGAAIVTAIVSILTGIPVRCDVAMTGEITLRGEVLPIGGLKEKLLAAGRGGIKTVLIPEENVKDLVEIPDEIKNRLEIHPVRWIEQVLEQALERQPAPLAEAPEGERRRAAAAPPRRSRRSSSTEARARALSRFCHSAAAPASKTRTACGPRFFRACDQRVRASAMRATRRARACSRVAHRRIDRSRSRRALTREMRGAIKSRTRHA